MFLFILLGNIYILIYGINLLSNTLDSIFFNKIHNYFIKIQNNYVILTFVGILFSFLTQSSTAITLITIAALNSNKINLKSGIAIVLGANIGTTFTSLLTSFHLDSFYYIFFIIAFFLMFFKKTKNFSSLFSSVGFIFLGLYLLKNSINYIYNVDFLKIIINKSNNNVLYSSFSGIIITALLQSSSALIALTQQLVFTNSLSLMSGIALVIGSNVGTTFTGLLSSINTNTNSKALAISHLLVNLIGLLLIFPFIKTLSLIHTINKSLFLFKINLIFNVVSSLLALLLLTPLSKLSFFLANINLKKQ